MLIIIAILLAIIASALLFGAHVTLMLAAITVVSGGMWLFKAMWEGY